jgi:hypothetical protein
MGRASAALFNGSTFQPWVFTRTSAERPGKFLSIFMESSRMVYKGTTSDLKKIPHQILGTLLIQQTATNDQRGYVITIAVAIIATLISIIIIGDAENVWFQRKNPMPTGN